MRGIHASAPLPCECARALLLLAFAACGTAFAATVGNANGDVLLADMRESAVPRPPDLADAERRKILAAAASAAAQGEQLTINSLAKGSFTAPGRDETVYLLQQGGPLAADPGGPRGVTIVVASGGRVQVQLSTDTGNFIQSSLDIDGDGIDELVLRADAYQMGIATTRLSLVSIARGRVTVLASFDEARVDRCGDTRFGGDVEAAVIHYRHDAAASKPVFVTDRYAAHCEDGEAPRADKFRAVAAPGS